MEPLNTAELEDALAELEQFPDIAEKVIGSWALELVRVKRDRETGQYDLSPSATLKALIRQAKQDRFREAR